MGLASLTVMGLGAILVSLTLNLATGWDVEAVCPGSEAFCDGVWWTAAVDYLPTLLFLGQILVVIALTSPFALVRV